MGVCITSRIECIAFRFLIHTVCTSSYCYWLSIKWEYSRISVLRVFQDKAIFSAPANSNIIFERSVYVPSVRMNNGWNNHGNVFCRRTSGCSHFNNNVAISFLPKSGMLIQILWQTNDEKGKHSRRSVRFSVNTFSKQYLHQSDDSSSYCGCTLHTSQSLIKRFSFEA